MKKLLHLLLLTTAAMCACQRTSNNYSSSPVASNSPVVDSGIANPSLPTPNRALTNGQVETAVNEMLSGYRLSGGVRVTRIQLLQSQNSAAADLRFEQFEYPVSFEGGLLRAKDFKPRKPSGSAIPTPEEMFPPRKVVYSEEGRAMLSKYTDGRWMLEVVNWGSDTSVKGSVEIR